MDATTAAAWVGALAAVGHIVWQYFAEKQRRRPVVSVTARAEPGVRGTDKYGNPLGSVQVTVVTSTSAVLIEEVGLATSKRKRDRVRVASSARTQGTRSHRQPPVSATPAKGLWITLTNKDALAAGLELDTIYRVWVRSGNHLYWAPEPVTLTTETMELDPETGDYVRRPDP